MYDSLRGNIVPKPRVTPVIIHLSDLKQPHPTPNRLVVTSLLSKANIELKCQSDFLWSAKCTSCVIITPHNFVKPQGFPLLSATGVMNASWETRESLDHRPLGETLFMTKHCLHHYLNKVQLYLLERNRLILCNCPRFVQLVACVAPL